MKSNVIVTANPSNGQVFTANANAGKDGKIYGYIRVQSTVMVENGGFLVPKIISALVPMSKENFDKAPLAVGTELGGKIVRLESLEQKPGYSAKTAGKDGQACTLGGQQIYSTTRWTTDAAATDVLIKHDNVIVGSSATAKASDALNK